MTYDAHLLECVSAPVFALASGKNGTFLAWNRSMSQVTGLPSCDVLGRTPAEVLGARASALSNAPPGAVQIAGVGIAVLERRDGVLIGTLRDMEREAYLGMAAHDLRAPLRNILYLAEVALAEPGNSVDLIGKMTNVARNGLSLTNDLVQFAQTLGLGEQPQTEVSLQPLVKRIVSTLDAGDAAVECQAADLTVEKPILTIALRNLLDNALRHGNGRRKIGIVVEPCPGGISIRVSDHGRGFKDSSLAFLAGGEFRVESGYGLIGLRRMLQARGGRINVEPGETGKGSAVVVTLPGTVVGSDRIAIAS